MGLGYTREDLAAVARGDADRLRWARMRGLAPAPEYEARNRALSGLAERGVGDPPPYYGPSDGKYSGFGTRGEQQDYGFGRGIQDWEQAQAFGDATALASDEAYQRISRTYADQQRAAAELRDAGLPTVGDSPELAAKIGARMRGASDRAIEARLSRPIQPDEWYTREGVPDHWSYEQVPVAPSGADRGLAVALGTPWAQATKPTGQRVKQNGEWVDVMSPAYELRPGFTGGAIGPEDLIPMMRAGGAPAEPATQTLTYGGRADQMIYPGQAPGAEQQTAYDERMAQLDKWARESGQDIMAGAAAAADEASVPLYMRAREAGINELGVDPALATAMWGPAEELAYRNAELGLAGVPIKQYQQDQDLAYLEQFGMTKSEYDAMLDDQRQAQDDARQFAVDEYEAGLSQRIADATGLDPKQLADKTDMNQEQIAAALDSDEYRSVLDALDAIIRNPDGVKSEAVDAVLMNLAQNDPDILRIVLEQFPWLPNVTPSFVGYQPTAGP